MEKVTLKFLANNLAKMNEVPNYLSFEKARLYVRKLDLETEREWDIYVRSGNKSKDIPSYPNLDYKEWISWKDFLGCKFSTKEEFLIYCDRNLIRTKEQYYKHYEENPDCGIPFDPIKYYNL
ncbi:hypothetical protein J2X69_003032 [Algoriphagus sp. 4150]|uniref:hypothetical protein n=1 Tax=Algoriphagus sp. 4150 TaxID=2817756 RepID=UPI00286524E5|nr:hypothetical protein [Algoriphagus sp. 4150]MDR7130675.1 hypothetical protein [Algoriphagus sp. 4150]